MSTARWYPLYCEEWWLPRTLSKCLFLFAENHIRILLGRLNQNKKTKQRWQPQRTCWRRGLLLVPIPQNVCFLNGGGALRVLSVNAASVSAKRSIVCKTVHFLESHSISDMSSPRSTSQENEVQIINSPLAATMELLGPLDMKQQDYCDMVQSEGRRRRRNIRNL